jgi:hypothetical protein
MLSSATLTASSSSEASPSLPLASASAPIYTTEIAALIIIDALQLFHCLVSPGMDALHSLQTTQNSKETQKS